jgi:hypothetical protein
MAGSQPDYEKPLRRMAVTYCAGAVALVVVFAIGSLSEAPGWLVGGATLIIVLAALVATACIDVQWIREQRRRRQSERRASGLPPERFLTRLRGLVRSAGLPGLFLSTAATLGLPLTIAGALGHVREVLMIGIVLLVLGLIDQAILWPIRHARAARTAHRLSS